MVVKIMVIMGITIGILLLMEGIITPQPKMLIIRMTITPLLKQKGLKK